MKTLIITVGTRQVGWKCSDSIVRCLGSDGGGYPPHIDELYQELDIERGYYNPKNEKATRWSTRHLGEKLYQVCQAQGHFNPVQLLMDHVIIQKLVAQGLTNIIIIGSNQPESVSWSYRRADTFWLAKLMAGKIQESWPNLQIQTWDLEVPANESDNIRKEIEGFIFPYIQQRFKNNAAKKPDLYIQNKGCAPAVANTLEICAAALVREFEVQIITPIEPDPPYFKNKGKETFCSADKVQTVSIAQYFWPLERLRIISAWERGDFGEAQVWLTSHEKRCPAVYKLALILSKANNWQLLEALKLLQRSWLPSKVAAKAVEANTYQEWQQQLGEILGSPNQSKSSSSTVQVFLQTWEFQFLIHLQINSEKYTTAFMQFSQTLERLLYLRARSEDWINKGYVSSIYDRDPNFYQLIEGWRCSQNLQQTDPWIVLLNRIREKRNDVVHNAISLNLDQLKTIWRDFSVLSTDQSDQEKLIQSIDTVLEKVCISSWPSDSKSVLQKVYDWSFEQLKSAA